MEMSGSVIERPVTVGNAAGRSFTGLHGDGVLATTGDANVANWPGANASGAGNRGGRWDVAADDARLADRSGAAYTDATRPIGGGWRGVRTADSVP